MNYEKIPTYIHLEDRPDPLNVWSNDFDSQQLSSAEMDTVMQAQANFDIAQLIKQWLPILGVVLLIVVGAAIMSGFFGLMTFQMLRDGTYAIASGAVSSGVIPT